MYVLTVEEVFPHGQQGEVEADVTDARVRAEDGGEGCETSGEEEWFSVQTEAERGDVQQTRVELERAHKQHPEMFKHLREKVPEQPDVGPKIGNV